VASKLAEWYVVIEEGRTVKDGRMADLVQDPSVVRRYLGAV
jgi:ABC-type branched-subunit amino acid transport system ATPase component